VKLPNRAAASKARSAAIGGNSFRSGNRKSDIVRSNTTYEASRVKCLIDFEDGNFGHWVQHFYRRPVAIGATSPGLCREALPPPDDMRVRTQQNEIERVTLARNLIGDVNVGAP
jgi:hypothetical protein